MRYLLPRDRWQQPNHSEKFGNIWYSVGVTLDRAGFVSLSPRTVRVYADSDDSSFGDVLAASAVNDTDIFLGTGKNAWRATLSDTQLSFSRDTGSNNPTLNLDGDAVWFGGDWVVVDDASNQVVSRPATGGSSQAYVVVITGLTSGKNHKLAVFQNRNTICVSNGNQILQKTSSYAASNTLTIPSDFEVVGMAYNEGKMGVITRRNNDGTYGQDGSAFFFVWNGATTDAQRGASVDSDSCLGVAPYAGSFAVLTRAGELKYWNGGGFTTLARFPFYYSGDVFGDPRDNNAIGNVYMDAVGDKIFINIWSELKPRTHKKEEYLAQFPAGVWCYDPAVGLYHRYRPSNTTATLLHVNAIDAGTDTLTLASGTVPATGTLVRLTQNVGAEGITEYKDYYLIKKTSTTFQLATTKELAEVGSAIDITSAPSGDYYFWSYNIVDYGQTYVRNAFAVRALNIRDQVKTDIILGARVFDSALATEKVLCVGVPELEARGYFVTSKIFANSEAATPLQLTLHYQPLSGSNIIVSARTEDVVGLPVSTPNKGATWQGADTLAVTQDISEAKTYLDNGGELECEILTGTGAGVTVPVKEINGSAGAYSVVLKEDAIGASEGKKCEIMLNNWARVAEPITSGQMFETTLDVPRGKFLQLKIEMRGRGVTIENIIVETQS